MTDPSPKKQLILIRHAKSAWESNVSDDYNRPLALRGINDINAMAHWLTHQTTNIDLILSSSATRAKQTTVQLCHAANLNTAKIHWQKSLYHAAPSTLLSHIHQAPATVRQLMLVGHNPGLDELLMQLCRDPPPRTQNGKLLTTAAIAILTLPDGWLALQPHTCHLAQLMRPKQLTAH